MGVPNLPGVPALSSFASPAAGVVLLTADAVSLITQALYPQWGIYLNGSPILASSAQPLFNLGTLINAAESLLNSLSFGIFSVVDFAYKQDWTVSTYPVEEGGFQSYDKVQHPFDVRNPDRRRRNGGQPSIAPSDRRTPRRTRSSSSTS